MARLISKPYDNTLSIEFDRNSTIKELNGKLMIESDDGVLILEDTERDLLLDVAHKALINAMKKDSTMNFIRDVVGLDSEGNPKNKGERRLTK